jgi:hypothetical protein
MATNTEEIDLVRWLKLAELRRRYRWQAEVSGPGSSDASVVNPNDFVAEVDRRLAGYEGRDPKPAQWRSPRRRWSNHEVEGTP